MKGMDYINSLQPNYQNANKETAPKKEITPVVTGKAVVRKKSFGKRLFGSLVANDAKSIGEYICKDILLPNVKDVISNTVTSAVDMALYGDDAPSRKKSGGLFSNSSYTKYYKYGDDKPKKKSSSDDSVTIDDIIFETLGDAQEVLNRMCDLLETYGSVSVADLYDLAGEQCDFVANKYGWTKLGTAEIKRLIGGGGYYIDLPKPKYID